MYFSQWSDGKCSSWDWNQNCSVLFSSSFFSGHQSSKPDMISQLEREEKFWTTEIQPQRGVCSGEHREAGPVPGVCLEHLCLLHAAAREAL